ncbi:MAG: beta-1,6-N-acetylglucosaminyltransferase [Bacteroidaceae bacterium]|nr:beta-1,6-N-acetylglucosaminyltransferase [Bacteroidaceae bacterium]
MHAYLIIAHNKISQLQKLISLIDDERNDIFILVDKKVKGFDLSCLKTDHSGLYELPREVEIYWGHISLVEAELKLFAYAHAKQHYDYYHLLSGVDMPLNSQDYIHRFCQENQGKEFISYMQPPLPRRKDNLRYQIFTKQQMHPNMMLRRLYRWARKAFILLQQLLGIKQQGAEQWMHGGNWCSVTDAFVSQLVERKDQILRRYRYSRSCDETYKPTLIKELGWQDRLFRLSPESAPTHMREIDWERGFPYIWRTADYDYLANSPRFFARKFDETVDSEIIDRLYHALKETE